MDKLQTVVKIPAADDASDKILIGRLADIVNTSYKIAETTANFAVAYLVSNNEPIGCVFVKLLTPTLGDFGMLALDTKYQGTGLGRQLAAFAEDECRRQGCTTMQLEILVPSTFHHEGKARLLGWYTRMGYKLVKLGDFGEDYPDLFKLLAGPTEYRVFEKTLV
ncbi:hypothetical protein NXS19_006673 [Fusarium pseudograminearum]|nr:hypothetical protein NXS19_006673 [Fusarium pseudograminearum]